MSKHRTQEWTCLMCGGRFRWGTPSLQRIQKAAHWLTKCLGNPEVLDGHA